MCLFGKKRKIKNAAPWWKQNLSLAVKKKLRTWKKYLKTKLSEDYKKYTKQRNITTKKIRAARRAFEENIVVDLKQEPKKLFKYVRSQLKVKAVVNSLVNEAGQLTETNQEAAEVLKNFFETVFVDEGNDSLPSFPSQVEEDQVLSNITILPCEVHQFLVSLDPDKAAGPDGIPSIVLKECASQLAVPLTSLFQKTLSEGRLPAEWKHAKICPVFKKGSKRDPSNYRPISLTCQVCKVLERILKVHISEHLESLNLISDKQHGFVKHKSTQSNLLESFNDWTKGLDEGVGLDVVFLDYSKAFDTVPFKRMLLKLKSYGLGGQVLSWIQDFLSARTLQVWVGDSCSSPGNVKSGVPQGSVLGPLFFIIYVNDVPKQVKSNLVMFADDTKMYRAIRNEGDEQVLQEDLDSLLRWSDKWLLRFNVSKCKVMHLGRTRTLTNYKMKQPNQKSITLEETNMEKDLGVYVTSSLKPTVHCQKVAKKAMSSLKLLRSAFDNLNLKNFKMLFTTYVRPHLEYNIQAVGPYMRQNFEALEKVQQRATKLVRGIQHLSYQERLRKLGLMSIEDRLSRGDMIETYKILTGKVKIDPKHLFELDRTRRTRGHKLKLKKTRADHLSRSKFFANRVITPWNQLPNQVVSAESTNSFKNSIDRYRATATRTPSL